ncbi:MAG: hypothetical protein CMO64_00240 [Verrucomicrobiales bacterium]|nr:hypothetical protein [Verrucomicrobiales bacterium]
MTAQAIAKPVKYAQLEWRNEAGERFDQFREDCLAYLREEGTLFTGQAMEPSEGGKVALEGNFHEGRPHGEELWYFENGNKNSLVTYRHGVRHGPHLVWHENGQLQIDVCYSHGKRDGRHSVFYENGQKRSQAEFVNDRLHGAYITWHEDGEKKSERVFKEGVEVKRREWRRNGEQKVLKNWNSNGSARKHETETAEA